jgi:site-specific DNA-methyltransferase (adenine-specific)
MSRPPPPEAGARLILGDCLEVMRGLPADSVEAVVTDPPYKVYGAVLNPRRKLVRRTNTWHPESTWDHEINPEWCREVCRIAPLVAWFGNWRRREEVAAAMKHPLRAEIVWAKNNHVGPPCPLAMRDERIWLFAASGIKPRRFETSVWDEPIIPTWAYRHHKNEKPVRLMRRLIEFLTGPGDTILDPFMGSGTTGIACNDTGRHFLGIESAPEYFAIAEARLAHARSALPLFP